MAIVKAFEVAAGPIGDPRRRAGYEAEKQMAHYLGRAFGADRRVAVLHGLRLEDEARPDVDGGPSVAQIDHLVLHRYGAFIVESKSCTGSVRISASASGQDEWAVKPRGRVCIAAWRRRCSRRTDRRVCCGTSLARTPTGFSERRSSGSCSAGSGRCRFSS